MKFREIRGKCKYKLVIDKEEIKTINLKAPLNNSFVKLLFKKGGKCSCYNEIYPGNWGAMYKIVDLHSAMNGLKEVFEESLRESKFYNFKGSYRIVTDTESVSLYIDNGKVTISNKNIEAENANVTDVKIPMNVLTSIYTGYKGIDYYSEEINFESIRDFEMFKVLFPLGDPYIWDLEMSDEIE